MFIKEKNSTAVFFFLSFYLCLFLAKWRWQGSNQQWNSCTSTHYCFPTSTLHCAIMMISFSRLRMLKTLWEQYFEDNTSTPHWVQTKPLKLWSRSAPLLLLLLQSLCLSGFVVTREEECVRVSIIITPY